MKTKKGLFIMISALAIVAIGLIVSFFVNWQVDRSNASGNVAKASRFSRQTATESLSMMEELILNDENYKNSIVVSYVVMQTRAQQFSGLVDMSNEAAGEIPAFADVLGKMNDVRQMAGNVCTLLQKAGESLEAILAGESRPEMGQQTNDAALAYMTLQKQNKLATQFIETADAYLAEGEGSDQLKFVRDQWLGYQMMTASLEGDGNLEKEMSDKDILLTSEQSSLALKGFDTGDNVPVMELALGSFTVLGNMSVCHQQHIMLNTPQVMQFFDRLISEVSGVDGTMHAVNITDDVIGHQIGANIQGIANGNVDTMNLINTL